MTSHEADEGRWRPLHSPALAPFCRASHSTRAGARLVLLAILLASGAAWAGPPFATDDPEPVPYRHWEIYLATQDAHASDGWSGTAPHVEVNYGVVPDVQLHAIVPFTFVGSPFAWGLGDVELGAKLRFLHETDRRPQLGTFPLVEVPTRGGDVRLFLPIWIQKSFGAWTTYGGGGIWWEPAAKHAWGFVGWEVQRRFGSYVSVGAELFHQTPSTEDASSETSFNVGLMVDVTDHHHILASAGRDLLGDTTFQAYLAYQLTFGI